MIVTLRKPCPRSGPSAVASWDSSPAAPSMNILEPHCGQGQYFLSIHAAFRTMNDFLLDNREMASEFSACRNNTEHEATSEESRSVALAILPLCLLLL
ncbi:hypothetical protein MRX96_047125 [Rhipicephalus microplus]